MRGLALWFFGALMAHGALPTVCPPLSSRDEAFNVRYRLAMAEGGPQAAFALTARAFAATPRPHVAARFGSLLVRGEPAGAPAGERAAGLALLQQALGEGSAHAASVLGWMMLDGQTDVGTPGDGLRLVVAAAASGDTESMFRLGELHRLGRGLPVNLAAAEFCHTAAGNLGWPSGLVALAEDHEQGRRTRVDLAKACGLYGAAGRRGSRDAWLRLKELAKNGEAVAQRELWLLEVWLAYHRWERPGAQVKKAAAALLRAYPEDRDVLLALGRLHADRLPGRKSAALAFDYLSRAEALGSADAAAERAMLVIHGRGTPRDEAAGVARLRELDAAGNAAAAAYLGYLSYWGELNREVWPKDAAQTFAGSRRAADGGDMNGLRNVADCYAFGIGVERDYAMAAKYYLALALRGWRGADESMQRSLNAVPTT